MTTLFRLFHVAWVLAHYRADTLLRGSKLSMMLLPLVVVNPSSWRRGKHASRGKRIRLALEHLGPIFVKFGQMLSTRPDLLPEDIVNELTKLQDRVTPFAADIAVKMIQQAYQRPIDSVFTKFDIEPLASASIAQVHAATLPDGSDVVVKVTRPNIEKGIRRDIKLLYLIAKILHRLLPDGKRLHLVEVVDEFSKTLIDELDMQREAANASQLRRNFEHSPIMYVPKVHWDYVRDNVLVIERLYGERISHVEKLRAANVDMRKLAANGVEIFYTQVFRDKFFHADMHPGNLFVDISDPQNPKYCGVDFGIMGSLSDEDQYYLAMNFLAFFNRDYRKVAQLHVDSNWVPSHTRVDEMEAAIRTVCEPIFNKPLNEISYGNVLVRLFQVARRFDMEIQPQLVLLQKTLINVEGLGRQLYPELNLWETAKPHLEAIMREQIGVRATLKKIRHRLPYWLERLPEVPDLLHEALLRITQK